MEPKTYNRKKATNCEHKDRDQNARGLCGYCYKRWLLKHNPKVKENELARSRHRWKVNRDKILKSQRENYARDIQFSRDRAYGYRLQDKYGLTHEDYKAMLDKQSGACAVCKQPQEKNRRLAVDHCHITNKVRGLLCDSCNLSIGRMNDDPKRLAAAADYLERFLVACGVAK